MPEEKVSTWPDGTPWNSAADAGPRQRCAVCGWPLAETRDKGCRPGDCSLRPLPQTAYDPERANDEYGGHRTWPVAVPPVPQEAAPRCEDCQWHGCGTGCGCKCHATAPDWAMRVAREIFPDNTEYVSERVSRGQTTRRTQAAALIRQAGSARERELATLIKKAPLEYAYHYQMGHDLPNCRACKWKAEASRLLGGES